MPPELTCQSIVYRGIGASKKIDEDSGRVKAMAFHERPNEQGVSVFTTAQACMENLDCKAVVSVSVGAIRNLELDVECDDVPGHANIYGLPSEAGIPDPAGRHKAGQLAKHCRYVVRPKHPAAKRVWDHFASLLAGSQPRQVWHSPGTDTHDEGRWNAKFEDGTELQASAEDLLGDPSQG